MSGQSKKKPKPIPTQTSLQNDSHEDERLTELRAASRHLRSPSTDSLEIVAISKRRRRSSPQRSLEQSSIAAPSGHPRESEGGNGLSKTQLLGNRKRHLASRDTHEDSRVRIRVNFREPLPEVCQIQRYIDLFPGLPKEPQLCQILTEICTLCDTDSLRSTQLQEMVIYCFESCAPQDSLVAGCFLGKYFLQLGFSSSEIRSIAAIEANKGVFAFVLKLVRVSEKSNDAVPSNLRSLILRGLNNLLAAAAVPYSVKSLKAIVKEVAPLALARYGLAEGETDLHRSCSSQPSDLCLAEQCMLHLSQTQDFWEVLELPAHLAPSALSECGRPRPSGQQVSLDNPSPESLLTYLQLGSLAHTHRPKQLLCFLSAHVFPPSPAVLDAVADGKDGVVAGWGHPANPSVGEGRAVAARVLRLMFGLVGQIGRKVDFRAVFAERAEERVAGFLKAVGLGLEDCRAGGSGEIVAAIGRIIRRICSPLEKASEPAYLTYFSEDRSLVRLFFKHGLMQIVEQIFMNAPKIMHPEVKLFILTVCLGYQHLAETDMSQWRKIITLVEEKLNLGVKRGYHTLAPDGQFEYYERGLLEFCKTYIEREIARHYLKSSDMLASILSDKSSEYVVQRNLKICKLPIMFEKYCHVIFGSLLSNIWIVEDESLHARFSKAGNETETGMKYWIKKKNCSSFAQERSSSHHKSLISKPDFVINLNCGPNSHISNAFLLSASDRFYSFNKDTQSLQTVRWQSKDNIDILKLIADTPTLRTATKPRVLHLQQLNSGLQTVLAVGYHRFPNHQNIPLSRPSAYKFYRLPSKKKVLDWQLPYNPNSPLTFHSTNHGIVSCSVEPLGYLALEFISKRKCLRFQAADTNNQLIHKVLLHDRYLVILTSHDVKICEMSANCRVASLSSIRTLVGSPFSEGAFLGKYHLVLVSKYDPLTRLAGIDLQTLSQFGLWLEQPEYELELSASPVEEPLVLKEASDFKRKVLAGCDPTQYKVKSSLMVSRDSTRLALIQWIPGEPYQASQRYSSVRICDLPTTLLSRLSRSPSN